MMLLFSGCSSKETIEIVEKESFYSDFVIKDDKVYIKCELSVENSIDKEQKVEIYANFPEDVKHGLLKYPELRAYQQDGESSEFVLQKGKTRIEVIFIGDFGGVQQKYDKNLPSIKIVKK